MLSLLYVAFARLKKSEQAVAKEVMSNTEVKAIG
jgi:hypothetical protein